MVDYLTVNFSESPPTFADYAERRAAILAQLWGRWPRFWLFMGFTCLPPLFVLIAFLPQMNVGASGVALWLIRANMAGLFLMLLIGLNMARKLKELTLLDKLCLSSMEPCDRQGFCKIRGAMSEANAHIAAGGFDNVPVFRYLHEIAQQGRHPTVGEVNAVVAWSQGIELEAEKSKFQSKINSVIKIAELLARSEVKTADGEGSTLLETVSESGASN